jgi:hypothetical protein
MKVSLTRANRWLTIVFAAFFFLQVFYLLVGFASLPGYYQRVTTQEVEPVVLYGKETLNNQIIKQKADARGLTLQQYATYQNIVNTAAALLPLGIAIVIIRRARWQWFAWFTAFLIVFLGEYSLGEQMQAVQLISIQFYGLNAIFWCLALLYFFLFPNGIAVPWHLAWLVIGLVIYHFFIQVGTVIAYVAPEFALRFNLPNWGNPAFAWPVLANFVIILACQMHRYRRVSTPGERQQTKWFLAGFALTVAMIPLSVYVDASGLDGFLNDFADLTLWLPVYFGLAIAITRYRLFDLDILIRRTLVYSLLSGLLGLVYFGGVALFQAILTADRGLLTAGEAVSGQPSAVVIVITTLAIAALFNPLRRRIQDFIDRRFYRRKYDAEKALAEFAAAARSEMDLQLLSSKLVDVVQQTVQPESARLWLARRQEGAGDGKR